LSRAARLLDLLQLLRQHRRPVSGAVLAAELGISLRSLYRDIATLQGQGAEISGEAGVGYVLRPGLLLPPLMFQEEEIEALALGLRWVAQQGDPVLADAARVALAKLAGVLPVGARSALEESSLVVPPADQPAVDLLPALRRAIRAGRCLVLRYRDEQGRETERRVWPFGLVYFDQVRLLAAWCELRGDFRHFRADRIAALNETGERYPQRRQALLQKWQEIECKGPL